MRKRKPVIYYCPCCWKEVIEADTCTACGADLSALSCETFDEKLIRALGHPEPTVPVRAALILGERGVYKAIEPLIELASTSRDPYIQEAAVMALGKIGDAKAANCLRTLAREGAMRPRRAAIEGLESLENAKRR